MARDRARRAAADALRRRPHPRAARGRHRRCARSRCSFRAGYMSADLEIELTNRKIPFEKWGGLKFLEAAHVKDVLAFLRILENPRDEVSWYRMLLLLPGIGDATARAVIESMAERGVGVRRVRAGTAPPPRARDAHAAPRRAAATPAVRAACRTKRRSPRTSRECGSLYDDILARAIRPGRAASRRSRSAADHRRRLSRSRHFPRRARARAAAEHAGSRRRKQRGGRRLPRPQHRAQRQGKGVGRGVRHLGGRRLVPVARAAEDEEELEEERRLMYVALTRARNHLAVTYPLNVYSTRRGAGLLDRPALAVHRPRRARQDAARRARAPNNAPAAAAESEHRS